MDSYALQQHVEELLSRHKARSFSTQWQNQKLWIKQHEPKGATLLPLLTRLLRKLSNNPLYYPSAEPKQCLKREATRLTLLKSRGIRVPQVVLSHDNYLVMTDLGPSIKFFLTEANISALEKQHILMAAAAALAQLHQQNRWHGRPALRDICWDGEQIGFIDFEEDPHQHLSIDQCMARDVLIFVHGLYRYLPANDPAILLTISEYQRLAPGRVWREALQIAENMWLAYPCLLTLRTVLGKDGRQAFLALRQLRRFNSPRRSPLSIILLSILMAFMLADQFD
ncbi:tRNA A-37 threonylcarbamoyl transferase component Bud32 [Rheinheimera pacifica]|uniref:tRNA A-37 threonylcarbamoyl transferase component Bud32 n=1 Tax=Rheinheimera pacifica TaxID=173990 RepID=A0A1H6M7F4_9GAMM|nr:hypothetical protein [Rheinheimera pacifica]SEH94818.1 tRNA A-37 threonylcarbamoyl transferase component Bud32 [Rheinheimera pacifica]